MASCEGSEPGDVWKLLCVVRGYHVYQSVWEPYLGDEFATKHEKTNPHDKYAMAVLSVDAKVAKTVGHLPREISVDAIAIS